MMNNLEVLKLIEADKFLKRCNNGKISDVYNCIIFDYDSGNNTKNFISIDVEEYELSSTSVNDSILYSVSIKFGLTHKENLDELASIIKDIVSDLYPDRKKYSNTPLYENTDNLNKNTLNDLRRVITFEIECKNEDEK